MSEISITIQTADRSKKAEVSLGVNSTGEDVLQATISNWSLPTDTDYSLVNAVSGRTIKSNSSLRASFIRDGDVLEVQPVLVAG